MNINRGQRRKVGLHFSEFQSIFLKPVINMMQHINQHRNKKLQLALCEREKLLKAHWRADSSPSSGNDRQCIVCLWKRYFQLLVNIFHHKHSITCPSCQQSFTGEQDPRQRKNMGWFSWLDGFVLDSREPSEHFSSCLKMCSADTQ